MRRIGFARCTAVLGLAAAAALTAATAHAIVPATPDGNGHPNVGAMVLEWRTPGLKEPLCTGTLVAPRIVLTAAHCDPQAFGIAADEVWVTFDPVYQAGVSTLYAGTFVGNPAYTNYQGRRGAADPKDVAVIHLEVAPPATPATLPTAGLLSTLNLKQQTFTAVGYGATRTDSRRGPHSIVEQLARNVATQGFLSLEPAWLNLSMNAATGSGGTCYGDSGGPHFLGSTNVVVSITAIGDSQCRATDKTYRLDTTSARQFLATQGVPLP